MATAKLEKVEQNILTCSICLLKFIDPVTLTCQHSYCRECIGEHIVTKSADTPGQPILCPVCNQDIRVPTPTRPVEEWAGQLKPSLVIQGLMDSLDADHEQKESTSSPCCVCHKLGKTTPGVMWCPECDTILCDNCVLMHRVQPTTLKHQLLEKSQKGKVRKRRKESCKKHNDKYIEIFCHDCDDTLCYSCYVDNHRNCKTVQSIESMIPKMKTDLLTHRRQLSEKRDFEQRRNTARTSLFDRLSRDRQSIRQKIQNKSQKAIKKATSAIKERERQLLNKLETTTENRLQQLKTDVKRGDIDKQTYEQFGEYIDQTLDSNCEMDIFTIFQTWKSGNLNFNRKTSNESTEHLMSVTFDESSENIDEKLANLSLGDIVVDHSVEGSTPVLHSTTDSRVESDRMQSHLHDVTVLDIEGVRTTVVTDHNNRCVKSFFTKDNHLSHSKLKLDSGPCGITNPKENQVMVAVPWSRQIVTLAVTPDLVHLSTLNTYEGYESLTVLSPTTIAAGSDNCVDILNMQGQVMKSLSTHNNVDMFSAPFYMCVDNKGNLLVSDFAMKCVTCVTPGGSVVWRYSATGERALKWPLGITTTHRGDILLVDSDDQKVIQLSESGQYVRDVLTERDGLRRPYGICVDSHGSLFVTDEGYKIHEFFFI